MSEAFLRLALNEQADILDTLAPELGRNAVVLEKDVWVCLVLQHLFQMPDRLHCNGAALVGPDLMSRVVNQLDVLRLGHRQAEHAQADDRGFLEQPTRSPARRPARPAQHPCEPAMARVLRLDGEWGQGR